MHVSYHTTVYRVSANKQSPAAGHLKRGVFKLANMGTTIDQIGKNEEDNRPYELMPANKPTDAVVPLTHGPLPTKAKALAKLAPLAQIYLLSKIISEVNVRVGASVNVLYVARMWWLRACALLL